MATDKAKTAPDVTSIENGLRVKDCDSFRPSEYHTDTAPVNMKSNRGRYEN